MFSVAARSARHRSRGSKVFLSPLRSRNAASSSVPACGAGDARLCALCLPPTEEGPIDRDLRVAVFDGGVRADAKLDPWVSRKKTKNIGDPVPEFRNHGTAVTSALLFGPLQDGISPARPYASVDHYRILDADTMKDDQQELYSVLERIQDVLESRPKYDFINLSLGPDLPIEDNDVHAWTVVLDQLFSRRSDVADNRRRQQRRTGLDFRQRPHSDAIRLRECPFRRWL